mgnify:CR=1 FL=1
MTKSTLDQMQRSLDDIDSYMTIVKKQNKEYEEECNSLRQEVRALRKKITSIKQMEE